MKCDQTCEVYSRIVGYFRPVANWNVGKKEEFKHRVEFTEEKGITSAFRPIEVDCGCKLE